MYTVRSYRSSSILITSDNLIIQPLSSDRSFFSSPNSRHRSSVLRVLSKRSGRVEKNKTQLSRMKFMNVNCIHSFFFTLRGVLEKKKKNNTIHILILFSIFYYCMIILYVYLILLLLFFVHIFCTVKTSILNEKKKTKSFFFLTKNVVEEPLCPLRGLEKVVKITSNGPKT